jgi:hypothetical protein
MKKQIIPFFIVFICSLNVFAQKGEDPSKRLQYEYDMTKDPKTGLVPRNELEKSRDIMSKMLKLMAPIPNVAWTERGPNNIGGRTRALMFDPNDATKKKVWAGGVSGGLWFNTDITNANTVWTKVDDFWDNIAIGDIAYDPSNPQIMYVGTGERGGSGAISNTGGSGSGGNGIWKTTNGGTTWTRLASTTPDYVNFTIASGWREVLKIIVNAQGHVFALNFIGVFRSTDGGTTWNALTGTNAPPANGSDKISDIELGADGILYIAEGTAETAQKIYKSTDNTVSAFDLITPPGVFANARVEIALAPSTQGANQVIYAVSAAADAPFIRFFKKSVNQGTTWTDMTVPVYDDLNNAGEKPFVGNQGWYDLILGTHATDPLKLYAGGVGYSFSADGGTTWLPKLGYGALGALMHVDEHAFAARPGFPDEAVFGNDGGVYYANNWGSSGTNYPALVKRNNGYNVTQYFATDINAFANNATIVGGTQDNGTHSLNGAYATMGSGFEINSGDGGLCFIDKLDSNIVISHYTNVTPKLNKAGAHNNSCTNILCNWVEMQPQPGNRGKFINSADYDSPNHTLYDNYTLGSEPDTKMIRYHITGTSPNYSYSTTILTITGQGALDISFIKLGKTQGNLFIGTTTGDVFKVTGINVNGDQTLNTITKIMDKATTSEGNVSCFDFGADENTIIVTKSNYNIKSVFYTTDGGTTWISKDEVGQGLTNIPIRYALINPVDTKQVLLATELGVWSTSDITAVNPQWAPTNTTLAHVRCDMLKYRASDNTVAVATHGRGLFTTKINQNGTPCPTTLVLISTANDTATGTTTFQASETITASNKITGNANVTMRAAKSVELKPSTNGGGNTFEAANGTVFQAFIAGCQN